MQGSAQALRDLSQCAAMAVIFARAAEIAKREGEAQEIIDIALGLAAHETTEGHRLHEAAVAKGYITDDIEEETQNDRAYNQSCDGFRVTKTGR